MSAMIGIYIHVRGAELKEHAAKRAIEHQKSADEGIPGDHRYTAPTSSQWAAFRRQERLVAYFLMLVEKLDDDAVYRLSNADLRMLEMPHGDDGGPR